MGDIQGITGSTPAPTTAEGQTAEPTATAPLVETDKYKGKSVEDLARMHAEAEKKLGEQGLEFGRTRAQLQEQQAQLEYLAQALLAAQQQAQPAPVAQPQPETTVNDAEWIQNPAEAVKKVASRLVEERTNQLAAQWQAQMAQTNYFLGMEQAMSKRPDLFQGIENEVQNTIMQGYRSGYVKPDSLRNPQTWFGAATLVRAMKGGWQMPTAQAGMVPPQTEMPNVGRVTARGQDDVRGPVTVDRDLNSDKFEEYLLKKGRLTEAEAAEIRKGR